MGLLLYPVFKPKVARAVSKTTGEFLAHELTTLDKIADKKGLARLSAFGDNREVPDDFDGSPDELQDLLGPFDKWFDPAPAKTILLALADTIKQDRRAAKRLGNHEAVIDELLDLARALGIAAEKGAKFHLELC